MTFIYCKYKRHHAVFDTKAHVYYFPFKTEEEARERAKELNQ